MALQFVVGLFETKGIAEDACNRLEYEGVAAEDISLLLLREFATPVPAAVTPEMEGMSVDPLIIGNVRETYAEHLHNGETAIFVIARTADDIDFAASVIKLYAPIRITLVAADEGVAFGRDLL